MIIRQILHAPENRLFAVFSRLLVTALLVVAAARTLAEEPRTLTTQFTYKATVDDAPVNAGALNLWIPLPSDSAWQKVSDVKVDAPAAYRITREPKFGNRMVYVRVQQPKAPVVVTVRCTVTRKEVRALDNPPENGGGQEAKTLRRDLMPDSKVPSGGRYAKIADDVVQDKAEPLAKMRAIFDHTVANMQYDYKKESPQYGQGDVAFVCDYKKGNCSDLHSYVISLARSQGIPCELEYGFPITGIPLAAPIPHEGTIGGYHCWTWFHIAGQGWRPLDASDARRWLDAKQPDIASSLFGSLVLERSAVAFSRGRDITLVPHQAGEPLNNFIYPYAEADGKATKAAWEVRYKIIK